MNANPESESLNNRDESRNNYGSEVSMKSTTNGERAEDTSSYWALFSSNREFRLFICSYLITHMGEWLTYVATINFIENQLAKQNVESRTAISILVVVRLLPNVILSSIGGTIADSRDRRLVMVNLDICGALCSLLFMVAYHLQSIFLIYAVCFVQECIAGIYQPSCSSIIPLLVTNENDLKKATTLSGLVWSVMMAIGSAIGGFISGRFGSQSCFVADGMTYLASAVLLWMMRGDYNVQTTSDQDETENRREVNSPLRYLIDMTVEMLVYLRESYFGLLIMMKGSAALSYGAVDVLKVAISEEGTDGIKSASNRLGVIFASVGVGCLLGPLISEKLIRMDRPATLQMSCVVSLGIIGFGFYGWAYLDAFWLLCIFAIIRSAGSAILWINSELLLQKFTKPTMLGRVLGLDYALALLFEALSAMLCGYLQDHWGFTVKDASFTMGSTGLLLMVFWGWYHLTGQGAASEQAVEDFKPERQEQIEEPMLAERKYLLHTPAVT